MQKVVFMSALAYLTLTLDRDTTIQFIDHHYTTEDLRLIRLLRGYIKKNPVMVAEAGEKELHELIEGYNDAITDLIQQAEEREKARKEEEKQAKELHEFYSALRMSDIAYR